MKKVWLVCVMLIFVISISGGIYWFYQSQEAEDKEQILIEQETEKYKKDCFRQSYPEDLGTINMYTDELKCMDKQYHQCLKNVIIAQINALATKEDAQKMVDALNKFEDSVLSLYWDLYNREDFGVMGRGVNDAALGRYYEYLLSDIINFKYISTYPQPL